MTGHRRIGAILRRQVWVAMAVVLLLGGVGSVAVGLHGQSQALLAPSPSAAARRDAVAAPRVAVALSTPRSVPVTLRIPALGMSVAVGTLGLGPGNTVQVPSGTQQPGWFDLGPTPGQIGSAVLLGHVDSYRGPGIFFNLRELAAGDQVDVDLRDGVTAQFTVNAVLMYAKTQFPSQRVYGSHGSSELQLVTCGGVFDHQTGSYLSNVVVYSSLTAVIPPSATTDSNPASST